MARITRLRKTRLSKALVSAKSSTAKVHVNANKA